MIKTLVGVAGVLAVCQWIGSRIDSGTHRGDEPDDGVQASVPVKVVVEDFGTSGAELLDALQRARVDVGRWPGAGQTWGRQR